MLWQVQNKNRLSRPFWILSSERLEYGFFKAMVNSSFFHFFTAKSAKCAKKKKSLRSLVLAEGYELRGSFPDFEKVVTA